MTPPLVLSLLVLTASSMALGWFARRDWDRARRRRALRYARTWRPRYGPALRVEQAGRMRRAQ